MDRQVNFRFKICRIRDDGYIDPVVGMTPETAYKKHPDLFLDLHNEMGRIVEKMSPKQLELKGLNDD